MREKWEKAQGTIVESPDAPPGATGPTFLHASGDHQYVIDVATPAGRSVRATVTAFSRFVHAVGEPIFAEVNVKTGEARIDNHAMAQLALRQVDDRTRPAANPRSPAAAGGVTAGQPAGSFPAGAFDTSGGPGAVEERLARLQQLLGKGILTESEYQAQRQQVISGI
jgi:hypothetical protein